MRVVPGGAPRFSLRCPPRMRYTHRMSIASPVVDTSPGIIVCILSRGGEAGMKQSIEAATAAMIGQRWALMVLVFGSLDDAGGVAKRTMSTAYRVIVHQIEDTPDPRHQINAGLRLVRLLRHECQFFTLLQSGDQIFREGFGSLVRLCQTHGHRIAIGQVATPGPGTAIPLDLVTARMALFVARCDILDFWPIEFDTRIEDLDTAFWEYLDRRGVAPGAMLSRTVGRIDRKLGWNGTRRLDALAQARKVMLPRQPAALTFLAVGNQALTECEIAIRSARAHTDPSIPVVVATDDVQRVGRLSAELGDIAVWPARPFQTEADLAMRHFRGPDWLRPLFHAVCCRPALAREVVARRTSCLMADTDILFVRPFGPLPALPAATPKSTPWITCGSYVEQHQWGIISAGILWFPPGSAGFIAEWGRQTLQNARLYRPGRSESSAPGGSAFAEQDGFDMAGHLQLSESLTPGHNVTPSSLGDTSNHLDTMRYSSSGLVREVCATLGFEVHGGLWRNGWPVRSLHCHWGGRQAWNGVFEDFVAAALTMCPATAKAARLISPGKTRPA